MIGTPDLWDSYSYSNSGMRGMGDMGWGLPNPLKAAKKAVTSVAKVALNPVGALVNKLPVPSIVKKAANLPHSASMRFTSAVAKKVVAPVVKATVIAPTKLTAKVVAKVAAPIAKTVATGGLYPIVKVAKPLAKTVAKAAAPVAKVVAKVAKPIALTVATGGLYPAIKIAKPLGKAVLKGAKAVVNATVIAPTKLTLKALKAVGGAVGGALKGGGGGGDVEASGSALSAADAAAAEALNSQGPTAGKIFGLPTVAVIGGGAALALGLGFVLLRKK